MNSKKTKKENAISLIDIPPKISFKIGEYVYERIERHIRRLKFQGQKDLKKKEWFTAALREKLEREKNQLDFERVPQRKHILFPLDKDLHRELQSHLSMIKEHCHYSSKELFLEAILEKLDREERQ